MSPKPESPNSGARRLAHVVGARPQFVKLAPVARAISAANGRGARIDSLIIHTGQHYDPSMSDVFFDELGIPRAGVHLGVGSGPHGEQTGRMLEKLELALVEHRPDAVLAYGDTNSTLAAAIAAAKLHIPVLHVEAGLRSFNRRMPEEINRVVADHLSDLLFAPTSEAMRNLATEGLSARAVLSGDVMLDAIRFNEALARSRSRVLQRLALRPGEYLVATVHRAESTDGDALANLIDAFERIARPDRPIVFPVHPRTAKRLREGRGRPLESGAVLAIEPLGYLDMIRLLGSARMVLTDSGGVQKEAFFLGRPCVTLREETEWVETVNEGGNLVAGTGVGGILEAVSWWDRKLAGGDLDLSAAIGRSFGNGDAAERILDRTLSFLASPEARIVRRPAAGP
ncbi:MAG TPA: UDP-N-acetylglucosamine 2-epimerase (non-hydrolyzing) [Steroidobacteraceae bacterium]